jgi:hypothetical protein
VKTRIDWAKWAKAIVADIVRLVYGRHGKWTVENCGEHVSTKKSWVSKVRVTAADTVSSADETVEEASALRLSQLPNWLTGTRSLSGRTSHRR